jgi:ubiquinol-cytochrome c reductase cytochrome b subunit
MTASRAIEGTGNWLDERFRGAKGLRAVFRKLYPDHWTFLLGEIALYSFIILVLTGVFLTLFFKPSMTEVVYHGNYVKLDGLHMSEAYASTLRISFDVRGGLLMRQIHHWAGDLFVAAIMVHMLRVFFTGAYRKPREVNWLIGIVLFTLALIEGLFGYSLPDDLLSGAGLRILQGVIQSVPVVGTYLSYFLFGGQYPGHSIIPRMYILHVLLIPGVFAALIGAHIFIMYHQKHTQMPGKGRTNKNVLGAPAFPYFAAKTTALFLFVFAAVTLAGTFAQINPIWLYGPYNTLAISAGAQPDFYMGMLEGALRVMPAWEWVVAGHTFAFNVFIPGLLPIGFVFTVAALWPFLEQWITGDKLEHHINDRPRNAPTRTALGMAIVTFWGVLWAEGANDLIAQHFDISLYTVTEIARVATFAVPILTYFITKRICLGLQRKDIHLMQHGVETGIIKQLPSGEFVEETRSLDEEKLAKIARPERLELPAGTTEAAGEEVPPPGMRRGIGRIKARLNKIVTETVPVNGHGANGHGPQDHGERAAISSGERGDGADSSDHQA